MSDAVIASVSSGSRLRRGGRLDRRRDLGCFHDDLLHGNRLGGDHRRRGRGFGRCGRSGFGGGRGDRLAEKLFLDDCLAAAAFGVEDGQEQGEGEEDDAEPDGEFLQDVGGLGSEDVLGHAAAERRAEAFILGALHEDDADHEQTDKHMEGDEDVDQDRHEPWIVAAGAPLVKRPGGIPR